jgi:hypothetical protein
MLQKHKSTPSQLLHLDSSECLSTFINLSFMVLEMYSIVSEEIINQQDLQQNEYEKEIQKLEGQVRQHISYQIENEVSNAIYRQLYIQSN